jgi:membrane associated rhomboid family serine protease
VAVAEQEAFAPREIPFRRPSWLPRWIALQFGRVALVIVATLLSVSPKPGAQSSVPVLLAVEFVVLCLVMFGSQARLRLRGGPPPVLLGPENITLPRSALSLRTAIVPYVDVRSVTVTGRGRTAQLIIDTARRRWRFPVDGFAVPDALARLQGGLRQHISGLPDGAARWDAIMARHTLAEQIGAVRPWGTWAITLVALLIFGVQSAVLRAGDGLGFVDAGANAALLVQHGQWFRLVTASLLHQNARHVVGNVLFVLAFGSVLEPLIGMRRIILVMLWSCLASQVVSTAVGLQYGGYLFAIGNSGGVYGLMGALAAVTWRFGGELPGGYRLPVRAWVFVGISVVAFPFIVTQVDHAAHAGGLAAGFLAGWLMVRGRRQLEGGSAPGLATNLALAALSCVWLAGIAAAAQHAARPAARAADRYTLAASMLAHDHFPPAVKNLVAWAVAIDKAAPAAALADAQELARRAVMQESHAHGPNTLAAIAVRDTEAVLTHRMGQDDKAIRMELPLVNRGAEEAAHLAEFVEATWRQAHLTTQGDAGPPPTLAIGHGVLILSRNAPVAAETDVLALLHRGGDVAGLLRFQLMPGFAGTQVLPLPSSKGGPSLSPPPPIWTDGKSTIDIARMDAGGCHCGWPTLVPAYYPYVKPAELGP